MTIAEIDVYVVKWPFTMPVIHSLARNTCTENIVVSITDSDGARGFGEGVPRRYVTGESTMAAVGFLKNSLVPMLLERKVEPDRALYTLPEILEDHTISRYPAACCAVEIALLDLAGRVLKRPVCSLLAGAHRSRITYSAVVPVLDERHLEQLITIIASKDMREVKIKVGNDGDERLAATVRNRLGPEIDLRVDANGAWPVWEALTRFDRLRPYNISSVEQPVAADDVGGLKQISYRLPVRVFADESVCTPEQAEYLARSHAVDGFNLKLSKCGGPGRALRMYQTALREGLVCMVGSQVGELGLLGAAGRHFAAATPEMVHVEGCLTQFYITRDLIFEDLTPGRRGAAYAPVGAGLGVTVDADAISDSLILCSRNDRAMCRPMN